MAYCDACKNEKAYHVKIKVSKEGHREEMCDRCSSEKLPMSYDVFLGEGGGLRQEENLSDPATGKPIPYTTKGEKAAIMKKLGLHEVGDRSHGMRVETKRRRYFTCP